MRTKSTLFVMFIALVLCGCGGGSGGRILAPETGSAVTPADWLVAAETAPQHVVGSSALAMTSDELSALDEQMITAADTQLYGGIYYAGKEFPGYILGTDCSEDVCKYGRTGEASLEDHIFDLEYQAVMEHKGIRLGQARKRITDGENPFDATGYGAWMHYGVFAIQVNFYADISNPDSIQFSNYAAGQASATNPVSGTGAWTGVAIGMDLNRLLASPHALQGDAEVTYDFGDASVDVTLDNFTNLTTGSRLSHTLEWADIAVQDGAFSDGTYFDGKHIDATFYGGYHEEVGGAFKSGSIAGSFGASRSDRQ